MLPAAEWLLVQGEENGWTHLLIYIYQLNIFFFLLYIIKINYSCVL